MRSAFAWCTGPAAAHGMLPLPTARPDEEAWLVHLRAARAAVGRGDVEGGLARFDEVLAQEPGCGVAHLGRTLCLAGLGRQEEAALALQQALGIGEAAPTLAFQFSRLAAREGRNDLAMDLLRHALAARPDLSESVLSDPAYRGLRDHPRLLVLVGRL